MSINIAIFASGSGTNAENIIQYFALNSLINVSLLLSNKADAYALERAKNYQIPVAIFSKEELLESKRIITLLADYNIDFIVLAGFLLKIPKPLIEAYPNKIINIHPALLPAYGGKGMYGERVHQAVVAAGEKESGITIHYVNEYYDEGTTIFQASCELSANETPASVAAKVHELEYKYFPQVIEDALTNRS